MSNLQSGLPGRCNRECNRVGESWLIAVFVVILHCGRGADAPDFND